MLYMVISAIALVVLLFLNILQFVNNKRKIEWYNSILDSIPFPLSITDNNMNWTFINKPVENMLSLKRKDVIGKHCSTWGAGICNTNNCGIACLKRGLTNTQFEQMGMDFQVHTSYLTGSSGKVFGHVEVVEDISSLKQMEHAAVRVVQGINDTSTQIVQGTDLISQSSQSLARGTTEQAASIEELSSTISEIAEKTKQNSQKANEALELSMSIKESAENSSAKMDQMVTAVREINEASQAIGNVMKLIDDIAFQTNILALNASVEAARAGQHGKGFAVVAEEVRGLATKSAAAASDTGNLITNSIEKAEFGNRIAQETARSLTEILHSIDVNKQIIDDIVKSSDAQAYNIQQISSGINQVNQVVQMNAAISQQSAAATEEITAYTKDLAGLLNDFKSTHK